MPLFKWKVTYYYAYSPFNSRNVFFEQLLFLIYEICVHSACCQALRLRHRLYDADISTEKNIFEIR